MSFFFNRKPKNFHIIWKKKCLTFHENIYVLSYVICVTLKMWIFEFVFLLYELFDLFCNSWNDCDLYLINRMYAVSAKCRFAMFVKCRHQVNQAHQKLLPKLNWNAKRICQKIFIQCFTSLKPTKKYFRYVSHWNCIMPILKKIHFFFVFFTFHFTETR